jgi:alanyl-tRNA synthetase
VIIEESGIAKGIRRLIAVTGEEAHEVSRLANTFETRLREIERLDGKEKDTALKNFTQDIGPVEISVLRKADIRDKAAVLRKAIDATNKVVEAAAAKLVSIDSAVIVTMLTLYYGRQSITLSNSSVRNRMIPLISRSWRSTLVRRYVHS